MAVIKMPIQKVINGLALLATISTSSGETAARQPDRCRRLNVVSKVKAVVMAELADADSGYQR
ncbi:MAG: hypothetical protein HKL96_03810 [Phycisphaerales bacterium]|nr:hypothetical protein [Phycisphaerales bacterium]